MSIQLQALARYIHNGRSLKPGDSFEVLTETEARDLTAVGFARRRDVAAIEQGKTPNLPNPGVYDRRDVKARE